MDSNLLPCGVPYRVIRSDRKTAAFVIASDGVCELRLPRRMPLSEAMKAADSHADWIRTHHLRRMKELAAADHGGPDYGTVLPWLGGTLTVSDHGGEGLLDVGPGLSGRALRRAVIEACANRAAAYLTDRTASLARQRGVEVGRITVTDACSYLGNCDRQGNIRFVWAILMADERTVDYVIWHELCHILEFSHSKAFWARVAEKFPDYRILRDRARTAHRRAEDEGWIGK